MTLYLLRHARAGRRSAWKGPDVERPLTKVGRRQAAAVTELLGDPEISMILSSPYVRCRQSVEPLAQRLGLPVDLADELAEGAELQQVLRLMDKVIDHPSVLCTHGDVMRLLLDHLARNEGVKVRRRNGAPLMEKGSVWELDTKGSAVVKATYRPPPRPTRT